MPKRFQSILSAVLCAALAALPVYSQVPAAPAAGAPGDSLTITILDGDGALNNIKQRVAREPIGQGGR